MLTDDITIEELADIRFNEGRDIGREEGREEGHEEGLEEGRDLGREEVIELFDQGLSIEEIKQRLRLDKHKSQK